MSLDKKNHYSYTVYADRDLAENFHTSRFGGPIGEFLAKSQEKVLLEFLGSVENKEIIDVGVGTGRAAIALTVRGAQVVGVDASAEMLKVAMGRANDAGVDLDLRIGDAHALAFEDQSFEAAVSLRVLLHTPDWRQCLGELCRVSRAKVVFDYPALSSIATLQVLWRRCIFWLGLRTEPYRAFSDRTMVKELRSHGFVISALHRQFVLPVLLHKWIGSRRLTEWTEACLARLGLLRLLGSPVTVMAIRCES